MKDKFNTIINSYSGISPTVGVILMVAITVGLAAVVGVTVFGLGGQVSENTGNVGLDVEQSGSEYTITANSGQFDSFDYIYVTSTNSEVRYTGGLSSQTYPNGPSNTTQYLYANNSGGTGTTVTIDISNTSNSGQIQVIGVANNNEKVINSYSIGTESGSSVSNTIDTINDSNLESVLNNMSGSGTQENPYEISNVYELQAVDIEPSAHYVIVKNIDASVTESWNNGSGFIPIGNFPTPFNGSLDGQSYQISDLVSTRPDEPRVGLISVTNSDASIKDIKMKNSSMIGYYAVGALIGQVEGKTSAQSIIIDSSSSSASQALSGGLIGYARDSITVQDVNIDSTVSTERENSGGVIGYVTEVPVTIRNASHTGDITGQDNIGGIIGYKSGNTTTIMNVTTTSTISSSNNNAGGVVGDLSGSSDIQGVEIDAEITSEGANAGGVVGILIGSSDIQLYHIQN